MRLTFASGDTLAGTANHPVLTERGWTALRDVQVGEHCIGHVLGQDGPGGGQPDVQRQPPTIEQVLETVARRGLVRRVAAVAVDLHGERPKSDVQVVSPDRKLRLGSTPSRLQPAKNLPLTLADVRDRVLATQGAALQLGFGGGLGPAGDVGSAGEGPALGFGHASQPGGQGSAEAATLDPALLQAQLDDLTADPQGDGKGLLGLPGQVALHQVVNVERVPFHGQVFTLETDSGWYLAGTSRIVARNCRCTMERIDAEGRVRSDSLDDASRDDMRTIAQALKVPRYSRMSKQQLRETIEEWSQGFGHQRLDQMTRAQLLQRAKKAGITGRHRMSKAELMRDLRNQIFSTRTVTSVDRWRLDNGYVTRQEMGLDVRRAKADAAKAFKAPPSDVTPLDAEQAAALRAQVFKRYDGEERGHVGCAACGAKLTIDGTDGEPMSLFRLNQQRGWEARNTIPVCASDATVMSSRGVSGFEPRGFVASAGEMASEQTQAGVRASELPVVADRGGVVRPSGILGSVEGAQADLASVSPDERNEPLRLGLAADALEAGGVGGLHSGIAGVLALGGDSQVGPSVVQSVTVHVVDVGESCWQVEDDSVHEAEAGRGVAVHHVPSAASNAGQVLHVNQGDAGEVCEVDASDGSIDVDLERSGRSSQSSHAPTLTAASYDPRAEQVNALVASNPWHDEVGRFARKGAFLVLTLPPGAEVGPREWFGKTLANETAVTIGGRTAAVIRNTVNYYGPSAGLQEHQPSGNPLDVEDQVTEAAAVAANVQALYPEMRSTWITVAERPPAGRGESVTGVTDGENIELYARNLQNPGYWDYFTGQGESAAQGNYAMPSALRVSPTTYITMHEMGHRHSNSAAVRDDFDNRSERLFRSNRAQLSGYGRDFNAREAYAEAFTEWHLTNGRTDNPDVQAWAAEFGWRTA